MWRWCGKTLGKVLSDDEQFRLTAIASCIHAKQDLRNMSFMNEDGFVIGPSVVWFMLWSIVKWLMLVYSSFCEPISEIQCHISKCYMSHSVTCRPTQVNAPRLNPSQAGQYSICLPWGDGRLSWLGWLVIYAEIVHLSKDSHPSR